MKRREWFRILASVFVMTLFVGVTQAQSTNFVAPGATPQAIPMDLGGAAAGGPSADSAGNVYFTLTVLAAKHTGSIQKWTWADGKVTKYRDVDGGAIGTAIDNKGRLLVGEWDAARITADDLKGNVTVLVSAIDGRKLLDPNAVIVDSKNGIYFTESGDAKSDSGDSSGVDYISPDGKTVKQAAKLKGARKMILSPDGKAIIVSGTGNKLWKFTVNPDGTLTDQQEFCTQQCANPVGFDENGNVYMAGDKLFVYSIGGQQLAAIDLPQRFSNATFAGKDRKTLFLSGHDGIYTLQMAVKGAPAAPNQTHGGK